MELAEVENMLAELEPLRTLLLKKRALLQALVATQEKTT
jgi:hypothetical protein